MTHSKVVLLALVSVFLLTVQISAQNQVSGQLRGYQEAPAISSSGVGFFAAMIDDAAQTISFQLFYQNLGSDVTAAHIHFAQRGVNGGIVAFLCGGGGQAACPPSGPATISGVITPANIMAVTSQGISAGEFSEVVTAMRSGVAYANIHTTNHGGGEIRGQLQPSAPAGAVP
jgi:hypothetical protein